MLRRLLVAWAFAVAFASVPRIAAACAVCATADPSLATPGTEQAFAGRVRASADVRLGVVEAGTMTGDTTYLLDRRLELSLSYAPSAAVMFTLAVPGLTRTIRSEDTGSVVDRTSLGDVELRATALLWSGSVGRVRQRLSFFGGTKLPTAPLERDANGLVLSSVLQPGCGSIVPLAGVAYVLSRLPWSLVASTAVFLPFSVRDGPHAGDSLRGAAAVQLQPWRTLAFRAGGAARVDTSGELASSESDPNSGGFIAYATTDVVVSPWTDVVVTAGGAIPVVEALRGNQHEGPVLALSAAFDF